MICIFQQQHFLYPNKMRSNSQGGGPYLTLASPLQYHPITLSDRPGYTTGNALISVHLKHRNYKNINRPWIQKWVKKWYCLKYLIGDITDVCFYETTPGKGIEWTDDPKLCFFPTSFPSLFKTTPGTKLEGKTAWFLFAFYIYFAD